MDYIKPTKMDRVVLGITYTLLFIFVLAIVGPLIYMIVASFMEPTALLNKGISFNPGDYNIEGYKMILSDDNIIGGFLNALLYSSIFTVITVSVCVFAGYPLSLDNFVGRKIIMTLFIITMFFGGGLIPTYLVVKSLGMLDTIWALVIPGAVSVWNIILARTFFRGLPKELNEAAKIDGASDFTIFFKIVIPLSKPIVFVLALYAFVGHWNDFFQSLIYLESQDKYPLQLVLRRILILSKVDPNIVSSIKEQAELARLSEMMKYAAIVISSLPLLVMYPFFQKYFEKGVMVGSLK
ncbi:carbohydrate ABC transporter permease [Paenibacillus sanguinis]|uniref:carbohydrate ABC transporter permease n=1 Tax=Paenibacillus sanguinis TaxID=225906 RepID=UPI00036429A4|nr:carbohydrate ABC transporter permease [Paenibacillus sanguinis]